MEIDIDERIRFINCSIEDPRGIICIDFKSTKRYIEWDSVHKTVYEAIHEANKLLNEL
jgi:hypothetical protein